MPNYSMFDFGRMIGPRSKVRVDAYVDALRRSITSESVVLEIGSGPGFFAILAAKFGARHVYAVDPSGAVNVGRELAEANGVAGRTTFIQDMSTNVTLPERADLVVSDLRGTLPWLAHHITSIVDARERLMKPDGVLIPARDTVWTTVVDAPNLYGPHVAPWDDNAYGLDLGPARARTTNHQRKGRVKPEQVIVEPQQLATLDYRTITDPNASADLSWKVPRPGTGHGLSIWFDTELTRGIGYSNAPSAPPISAYGQLYLPWTEPVDLAPGDLVHVALGVRLVRERYAWNWSTRVEHGANGEVKASFTQASFAARAASLNGDSDRAGREDDAD